MESLIILPVVFLTKDLDWTDETILFYARIGFAVAQVLAIAVYLFLRQKITSGDDKKPVKVKATPSLSNPTPDPNEVTTMTTTEYDLSKVKEALQQVLMTSVIISAIHYKWGYGVPLVIQCITVPLNLYKNDLVKVHLLGHNIPRPFLPPPSPFSALTEGLKDPQEEQKRKKEEKKEKRRNKVE